MDLATVNPPARPAALAPIQPLPGIDLAELDGWIEEIAPITASLANGSNRSIGRRRWLAHQRWVAFDAVARIELALFDAEALDQPTEDLAWLHTRASTLLGALSSQATVSAAA